MLGRRPPLVGCTIDGCLDPKRKSWLTRIPRGEEIVMSCASRVYGRYLPSCVAALAVVGVLVVGAERLSAESDTGSAGPLAQSCGVPAAGGGAGGGRAGGGRGLPVFPPG